MITNALQQKCYWALIDLFLFCCDLFFCFALIQLVMSSMEVDTSPPCCSIRKFSAWHPSKFILTVSIGAISFFQEFEMTDNVKILPCCCKVLNSRMNILIFDIGQDALLPVVHISYMVLYNSLDLIQVMSYVVLLYGTYHSLVHWLYN